jgi:hypothetical protein
MVEAWRRTVAEDTTELRTETGDRPRSVDCDGGPAVIGEVTDVAKKWFPSPSR